MQCLIVNVCLCVCPPTDRRQRMGDGALLMARQQLQIGLGFGKHACRPEDGSAVLGLLVNFLYSWEYSNTEWLVQGDWKGQSSLLCCRSV